MQGRSLWPLLLGLYLLSAACAQMLPMSCGNPNLFPIDLRVACEPSGVSVIMNLRGGPFSESLPHHCMRDRDHLAEALEVDSSTVNLCQCAPFNSEILDDALNVRVDGFLQPNDGDDDSVVMKTSQKFWKGFYHVPFQRVDSSGERCAYFSNGSSIDGFCFSSVCPRLIQKKRDHLVPSGLYVTSDLLLAVPPDSPGAVRLLARRLEQNGLHGVLHTDLLLESSRGACDVMLLERLDQNVFVDSYELANLERMGGTSVRLFRDIDLEKPTDHSTQNLVFVLLSRMSPQTRTNVSVPVHFRYQRPSSVQFNSIRIASPVAYIRCGTGTWVRTSATVDFEQDLIALLPVGRTPHAAFVSSGTLGVTALAAVVAALVVLRHR